MEVLALPPALDAAAARSLQAGLLARRGADLDLDGTAVGRVGTPGLAVLLAAAAAWARDGLCLRLPAPSPALREAAAALALPPAALPAGDWDHAREDGEAGR